MKPDKAPSQIRIVEHATLEKCVLSFVNLVLDESGEAQESRSLEEWIISAEDSGDGKEYTIQSFIDTIKENHMCWGFSRQSKTEIHVWLDQKAHFLDVLALFAHELGHFEPWIEEDEEEQSESYGRVAVLAYKTATIHWLQPGVKANARAINTKW